jgi:hypothetical protein
MNMRKIEDKKLIRKLCNFSIIFYKILNKKCINWLAINTFFCFVNNLKYPI